MKATRLGLSANSETGKGAVSGRHLGAQTGLSVITLSSCLERLPRASLMSFLSRKAPESLFNGFTHPGGSREPLLTGFTHPGGSREPLLTGNNVKRGSREPYTPGITLKEAPESLIYPGYTQKRLPRASYTRVIPLGGSREPYIPGYTSLYASLRGVHTRVYASLCV